MQRIQKWKQSKARVCIHRQRSHIKTPILTKHLHTPSKYREKNSVKQQPQWSFWPRPGHADVQSYSSGGGRKPSTITARQFGQQQQQAGQGAEQQCPAPIPSCESSDPAPSGQSPNYFKRGESHQASSASHTCTVTLQCHQQIAFAA